MKSKKSGPKTTDQIKRPEARQNFQQVSGITKHEFSWNSRKPGDNDKLEFRTTDKSVSNVTESNCGSVWVEFLGKQTKTN